MPFPAEVEGAESGQFPDGETGSLFTDMAISADPAHAESSPPLAHYNDDVVAGEHARFRPR